MSIITSITTRARILLAALLLLAGSGTATVSAADNLQSKVDAVVTTASTNIDKNQGKSNVLTKEVNGMAVWLVWIVWGIVPLVLFGGLIAWGVWQAKQNEADAAKKTFVAVGIGIVFYFGVVALFFT